MTDSLQSLARFDGAPLIEDATAEHSSTGSSSGKSLAIDVEEIVGTAQSILKSTSLDHLRQQAASLFVSQKSDSSSREKLSIDVGQIIGASQPQEHPQRELSVALAGGDQYTFGALQDGNDTLSQPKDQPEGIKDLEQLMQQLDRLSQSTVEKPPREEEPS